MLKYNNCDPSAIVFSSNMIDDMAENTKRTTIVLPRAVYEALEEWADSEGRATANLAAFMVEQAVRAKFPDRFPPRIRIDRMTEDPNISTQ
jgi:hypothetical protein